MKELNFETFMQLFSELNESQYQAFIQNRLDYLNLCTSNNDFLGPNNFKKGYIAKDFPLYSGDGTYPLFLDDDTIFLEFLHFLKSRKIKNIYALLNLIQQFVSYKFGFNGNPIALVELYSTMLEIIGEEKNSVSISEFYKKNIAMCFEKSAIVQNLLTFVGVSSTMVCGILRTPNTEELHAFTIINYNDKEILFDVANPLLATGNGKKRIFPAISIISLDENPILFDYNFMKKVINNSVTLDDESSRQYFLPTRYYEQSHSSELK